jgi:hypothetical protein
VSCPTGSKPLGGGVSVASIDNSAVGAGVTMAANEPEGRQWLVQESNAGTTNASASAVVVCGSVPKYRVLASREQHVPAQTQLMMKATCPAPTVVMGGGGSVKALSFSVNFAWSTMNEGFDWFLAVNNATDEGIDASAVVICGS